MSEAIAQEAARKNVKDVADSHGRENRDRGDSGGVNELTRDNRAVVCQSEVKVTQETESQVSPPETRSGASAVAARIPRRITANTMAQSVSSVARKVICSLNVLTGSALPRRRKIDMSVSLPLLIVRAEKYAPPLLGTAYKTKIPLDWKNLFLPSNGQFVAR